jgi:rod shape-determining protein MreC
VLSRSPGQSRFTLAVLVVISITVLVIDLLGLGPLGAIRDAAVAVAAPFRAAGDAVFGALGADASDEENDRLRERIAELEGAEAEAANARAELEALREQLGLLPPEGIDAVAAQVVGGPRSNFDRTIEIDKGSDAGIQPGMPVRTSGGLVGVVDRVSFNRSSIELITEPDLQIGVRHVPSRDAAVARGQGEGTPLLIESAFDAATEVHEDDVFVTLGLQSSAFPPDIPVGRVIEKRPADNPLEQQVLLEPAADLERLTHVAVLLYTPSASGGEAG